MVANTDLKLDWNHGAKNSALSVASTEHGTYVLGKNPDPDGYPFELHYQPKGSEESKYLSQHDNLPALVRIAQKHHGTQLAPRLNWTTAGGLHVGTAKLKGKEFRATLAHEGDKLRYSVGNHTALLDPSRLDKAKEEAQATFGAQWAQHQLSFSESKDWNLYPAESQDGEEIHIPDGNHYKISQRWANSNYPVFQVLHSPAVGKVPLASLATFRTPHGARNYLQQHYNALKGHTAEEQVRFKFSPGDDWSETPEHAPHFLPEDEYSDDPDSYWLNEHPRPGFTYQLKRGQDGRWDAFHVNLTSEEFRPVNAQPRATPNEALWDVMNHWEGEGGHGLLKQDLYLGEPPPAPLIVNALKVNITRAPEGGFEALLPWGGRYHFDPGTGQVQYHGGPQEPTRPDGPRWVGTVRARGDEVHQDAAKWIHSHLMTRWNLDEAYARHAIRVTPWDPKQEMLARLFKVGKAAQRIQNQLRGHGQHQKHTPSPDLHSVYPMKGQPQASSGLTQKLGALLMKGEARYDDLYRSYKHTPHNAPSLLLKYAVHRLNHLSGYDDPAQAKKLDDDFLKLHQYGDATNKNGHVTIQDLHWMLAKNPSIPSQLVKHRKALHEVVRKGVGINTKVINGQLHVALSRGLTSPVMSHEHALSSFADIPSPPNNYGPHKHRAWVNLKDVWYSYDLGPNHASSAQYGPEDEWLVSNVHPRYQATAKDVTTCDHQGSQKVTEHYFDAPHKFTLRSHTDQELAERLQRRLDNTKPEHLEQMAESLHNGVATSELGNFEQLLNHENAGPLTFKVLLDQIRKYQPDYRPGMELASYRSTPKELIFEGLGLDKEGRLPHQLDAATYQKAMKHIAEAGESPSLKEGARWSHPENPDQPVDLRPHLPEFWEHLDNLMAFSLWQPHQLHGVLDTIHKLCHTAEYEPGITPVEGAPRDQRYLGMHARTVLQNLLVSPGAELDSSHLAKIWELAKLPDAESRKNWKGEEQHRHQATFNLGKELLVRPGLPRSLTRDILHTLIQPSEKDPEGITLYGLHESMEKAIEAGNFTPELSHELYQRLSAHTDPEANGLRYLLLRKAPLPAPLLLEDLKAGHSNCIENPHLSREALEAVFTSGGAEVPFLLLQRMKKGGPGLPHDILERVLDHGPDLTDLNVIQELWNNSNSPRAKQAQVKNLAIKQVVADLPEDVDSHTLELLMKKGSGEIGQLLFQYVPEDKLAGSLPDRLPEDLADVRHTYKEMQQHPGDPGYTQSHVDALDMLTMHAKKQGAAVAAICWGLTDWVKEEVRDELSGKGKAVHLIKPLPSPARLKKDLSEWLRTQVLQKALHLDFEHEPNTFEDGEPAEEFPVEVAHEDVLHNLFGGA